MTKAAEVNPQSYKKLLKLADEERDVIREVANPRKKCQALQAVAELTLKAMITATGNEVRKTHDLVYLWNTMRIVGCAPIPVQRNDDVLRELAKYANDYRYEPPREAEAKRTLVAAEPMVEALNRYANQESARLAKRGQRRIRIMWEMRCAGNETLEVIEKLLTAGSRAR